MNPAITMQVITHAILWIFIFSEELVGRVIIPYLPHTSIIYLVALLFAMLCFCVIGRLGSSALLRDMQDLFLYDLLLQSLGVYLKYFDYKMEVYVVLIGAITILKFVRLLWIDTKVSFGDVPGWPVFGLVGVFHRHQMRRRRAPAPGRLSRRDWAAYGIIFGAILLSWVLFQIKILISYMLFGMIPFVIISLYYKRFIKYLEDSELARIEADKKLAVAAATAEINAELSIKNQELLEANHQRDLMLADLTVRNECLRDASHDLAAPAFWITACAQQLAAASDDAARKALCVQLLDSVGHYNQLLQATIHGAKLITKIEQPTIAYISANKLANYLWDKYLAIFEEKGLRFGIYKANQFVINDDGSVMPDVMPERIALKFKIATDEHILMRILNNLIMNALRNTAHGRVRVAFRKRNNGVCWIEVRDTGKGFAGVDGPDWAANFDEVSNRIKAGKMKASEAASHGLGINNIKNLCASINTTMLLHSRVGHGSLFRFAVPLAPESADETQCDEKETYYFG